VGVDRGGVTRGNGRTEAETTGAAVHALRAAGSASGPSDETGVAAAAGAVLHPRRRLLDVAAAAALTPGRSSPDAPVASDAEENSVSTQWHGDDEYGSRAQPSVRDDIDPVSELPGFDYSAAVAFLLIVLMAAWMTHAHLVGHTAGVTSGLLLGLGGVAAWYVGVSVVELALHRRRGRR
jgi:hypothetical protein